ncbi:ATP-binding protein [Natronorubrum halophilum]|uniref:ATP-binding protein n=1 Tax=Natronorubrum halophilum TaxID=1702106 RepID=UPI000EF645A7|nr:ATP-binding protein [Natronorubrum halophilum]
MSRWSRFVSVFGLLLLVIATGQSALKVAGGGSLLGAMLDFVVISICGLLVVFVGSWLTDSDIDSTLYRRIVGWCFGGVSVMFIFLFLRAIHPDVATTFSFGTRAVALSIGSVAGLGIGIHEARAITREREIRQHNHALQRAQDRLEQRNDELSRIRMELEDAVTQLEASNERLDQFASTASHDLREPLRMISQYLGLLEDRYAEDLDDDGQEFIAYALDGAERLQTMVDDLLEYSRIETQGDPFASVDLDDVLADALTDLQVRIDESDATIEAESLPRVHGDKTQLRQLFQNLLTNALEYSGDEPPRVQVVSERRETASAERELEWVISVRDEGIGIPPADQRQIFELFERLHTSNEHAGSGIGLAFCQRTVERHGGEIWVESESGEGSTFSFTIPNRSAVDPIGERE